MFDDETQGKPWSPLVATTDDSWELQNRDRCIEINDQLDKLSLYDRRVLYQTLSDAEQSGIIPEYGRRRNNEIAPPGSMVRCKHVWIFNTSNRMGSSHTYDGTALVIAAPERGGYDRILYLTGAIEIVGYGKHKFARSQIFNLKVIK